MIERLKNCLKKLQNSAINSQIESILVNQAKSLIQQFDYTEKKSLDNYEFKVFSQWGDDGIIQYLIHTVDISNKRFIEFGVEDYTEANTRFLLINNNWSGLVMDGSTKNMNKLRKSDLYWKYDLTALDVFITEENINKLFIENNFEGEIGILHIDIDGNDYHVWKQIDSVDADIVIVEYNSLFGKERAISVPYNKSFTRTEAHYSNLYYGSSLLSLCDLATEKGFSFVGCNQAGNNAYFVKNNKLNGLKALTCEEGYVKSKFKEGRNEDGRLTFMSFEKRERVIQGLEAYNTRSMKLELI